MSPWLAVGHVDDIIPGTEISALAGEAHTALFFLARPEERIAVQLITEKNA
ncbi:hypothetical protein [Moellerella wisconsensis]|uniref:hypothetical protein n=1 Tax=Moellerella wisconsensis TaxID=158849 RepID=UPI0010B2B61C|nr:hypothetical protein [Moellerella wisconsensis]UNH23476.1 hypothetical protein MNY68_11685 [Moellerella wisconsensis]VFS49006.1 Uncharacterised protein [Moellerella wisconsensis]